MVKVFDGLSVDKFYYKGVPKYVIEVDNGEDMEIHLTGISSDQLANLINTLIQLDLED